MVIIFIHLVGLLASVVSKMYTEKPKKNMLIRKIMDHYHRITNESPRMKMDNAYGGTLN